MPALHESTGVVCNAKSVSRHIDYGPERDIARVHGDTPRTGLDPCERQAAVAVARRLDGVCEDRGRHDNGGNNRMCFANHDVCAYRNRFCSA